MNLEKVAQAQRNNPELAELMQSSAQHSLVLQRIPLPSSGNIVICDSNRDTTPICVHPTEELGFYSPVFIITPGNPEILCGQESTKTSESGHVSVYCVNALKYTNMLSLLSLAFLSQNIGSLICICDPILENGAYCALCYFELWPPKVNTGVFGQNWVFALAWFSKQFPSIWYQNRC